jgi:hypothetical protein
MLSGDSQIKEAMENKNCKMCLKSFEVPNEDLEFYQKISPTYADKTFQIPSPELCPECRQMTRQSWRNETNVYVRKSDKSGKQIVSMFSPDKTDITIYANDEWWSDDWDGLTYGREFDRSRSFFEQFRELLYKVPKFACFNINTENCLFDNYIMDSKDCYMCFANYYQCENCFYCYMNFTGKDSSELHKCEKCEKCFRLNSSNGCFSCNYGIRLENCSNCWFSIDLTGCRDCILCSNMNHKQYCINNEQLTKGEYEEKIKDYNFGSHEKTKEYLNQFAKLRKDSPVKFANNKNCENCNGDFHIDCKNVHEAFDQRRAENVKYSPIAVACRNSQDIQGGDMDWCYLVITGGYANGNLACHIVEHCNNMKYCNNCFYCNDCFGCVGLRNKQYCVFNQQCTSKDEYEKKVSEIIERMVSDGEWGQFFPIEFNILGFNESFAVNNFKLTKDEALKLGFKWQENDFGLQHDGEFYEPEDDIKFYSDEARQQELLAGVLKCEVSGKSYTIQPGELAFYLKQGLPIPRNHFKLRIAEMFEWRNPRKLFRRKCMNEGCEIEFETTYAPERQEKVYCEKCYQNIVR